MQQLKPQHGCMVDTWQGRGTSNPPEGLQPSGKVGKAEGFVSTHLCQSCSCSLGSSLC